MFTFTLTVACAEGNAVGDELDTYLGYNPRPLGQSVLEFYRTQAVILPGLSSVTRRILCVPATSTSSERLFTHAGNVFTDRPNRLGAQNLDDLLLLCGITQQSTQMLFRFKYSTLLCVAFRVASLFE